MAVAAGDPAIEVVNAQLGLLIAADLASLIDGFLFRVVMAACPLAAAALHMPAAVRVMDNVVAFGTSRWFHAFCLYLAQ